jgi:uncharacterized damage-inducible protein DinB
MALMSTTSQAAPPRDLDDSVLLRQLDCYRLVVLGKAAGLDRDAANEVVLPSRVTLLGVVAHLAEVEREWFGHCVIGEPMDDYDNDDTFRVDADASVEDVVGDYREACLRSKEIVAQVGSLDAVTREPHWYFGIVTVRYVVQHVITETARHTGHLDILRELTDGAVGDDHAPDQL